jgi:hypothetical protein
MCLWADAQLLLRTGRPAMALTVLDKLGDAITVAVESAHEIGLEQGRTGRQRPARKSAAASASSRSRLQLALAAALAEGRITVERVAELLRVEPADVERIASGRVGLAPSAWKRLLRGLGK